MTRRVSGSILMVVLLNDRPPGGESGWCEQKRYRQNFHSECNVCTAIKLK